MKSAPKRRGWGRKVPAKSNLTLDLARDLPRELLLGRHRSTGPRLNIAPSWSRSSSCPRSGSRIKFYELYAISSQPTFSLRRALPFVSGLLSLNPIFAFSRDPLCRISAMISLSVPSLPLPQQKAQTTVRRSTDADVCDFSASCRQHRT